MKSTEIRSQNVTILFNILGSNWESDPYSAVHDTLYTEQCTLHAVQDTLYTK